MEYLGSEKKRNRFPHIGKVQLPLIPRSLPSLSVILRKGLHTTKRGKDYAHSMVQHPPEHQRYPVKTKKTLHVLFKFYQLVQLPNNSKWQIRPFCPAFLGSFCQPPVWHFRTYSLLPPPPANSARESRAALPLLQLRTVSPLRGSREISGKKVRESERKKRSISI